MGLAVAQVGAGWWMFAGLEEHRAAVGQASCPFVARLSLSGRQGRLSGSGAEAPGGRHGGALVVKASGVYLVEANGDGANRRNKMALVAVSMLHRRQRRPWASREK